MGVGRDVKTSLFYIMLFVCQNAFVPRQEIMIEFKLHSDKKKLIMTIYSLTVDDMKVLSAQCFSTSCRMWKRFLI